MVVLEHLFTTDGLYLASLNVLTNCADIIMSARPFR